jgi:hypothetical protein
MRRVWGGRGFRCAIGSISSIIHIIGRGCIWALLVGLLLVGVDEGLAAAIFAAVVGEDLGLLSVVVGMVGGEAAGEVWLGFLEGGMEGEGVTFAEEEEDREGRRWHRRRRLWSPRRRRISKR